jgi:hypothetical protein
MKSKGRPRTYLPAEHARAIYLAGAGEDAGAIADLIGNTDAARIRAMLSGYGVPLLRRGPNQTAMLIIVGDVTATDIAREASLKGFAPALLIGGMVDAHFARRRPVAIQDPDAALAAQKG